MMRAHVTLADRDVAWKAITVRRSLDAFVGSASVVLALHGALPAVGASLRVSVSRQAPGSAETLLLGFVDAVGASGSALGGEVTVDGRDRTADLIDGSRIGVDWRWSPPATLLDVARTIASAWSIGVDDEAGAAALQVPYTKAMPGETAYEVLERTARLHGVLVSTTPAGRIRLGHPVRDRAGVELRTGASANITRWTLRSDGSQRFRRTQVLSPGSLWELLDIRPSGIAEDAAVREQRESVVVGSGDVYGDELEAVARWQVAVARARSSTLTVEIPSLTAGEDGPVWTPGMVVSVSIPEAEMSGDLLVDAVDLTLDEGGETASLGLVWPAAYEIDPTEAERQRRGSVEALLS